MSSGESRGDVYLICLARSERDWLLGQFRVLGLGLLRDGDVRFGVFPEGVTGFLTVWILAAEQRQNHSGRAKQRDSFHPATS
jgi:hypothetical protein